jgi:hypothetical protein
MPRSFVRRATRLRAARALQWPNRPPLEPSLWAATAPPATPVSGRQLVALVFAAQVLVQIGASFWPALLPGMVALWD